MIGPTELAASATYCQRAMVPPETGSLPTFSTPTTARATWVGPTLASPMQTGKHLDKKSYDEMVNNDPDHPVMLQIRVHPGRPIWS